MDYEAPTKPAEWFAHGHTFGKVRAPPSLFLVTHILANAVMLIIFYEYMSYFPQLDDKQRESTGNLTCLPPSPST